MRGRQRHKSYQVKQRVMIGSRTHLTKLHVGLPLQETNALLSASLALFPAPDLDSDQRDLRRATALSGASSSRLAAGPCASRPRNTTATSASTLRSRSLGSVVDVDGAATTTTPASASATTSQPARGVHVEITILVNARSTTAASALLNAAAAHTSGQSRHLKLIRSLDLCFF
jgi:hypothetical protein